MSFKVEFFILVPAVFSVVHESCFLWASSRNTSRDLGIRVPSIQAFVLLIVKPRRIFGQHIVLRAGFDVRRFGHAVGSSRACYCTNTQRKSYRRLDQMEIFFFLYYFFFVSVFYSRALSLSHKVKMGSCDLTWKSTFLHVAVVVALSLNVN